jgi:membrane-associated phospholipid phosphatase
MTMLASDAPGRGAPTPGAGPDWAGARRALLLAVVGLVGVAVLYVVFVRSASGQRLDQGGFEHIAGRWSSPTRQTVASWLRDVTIAVAAVVLLGCVAVAFARRRFGLGLVAVGIVVGASLTTQALKHVVFERPHLGYGWTNSLPSGHTTVVTSLALASLLVVPRAWRGIASVAAAVAVTVAGVGTVVAGWHRPSDVVAAFAVCLTWGAVGLALVSVRPGFREEEVAPRAHPFALLTGLALAAAVFLEVGVRPEHTARDIAIHAVIMCGIAIAGAIVVGLFTRMANARTS